MFLILFRSRELAMSFLRRAAIVVLVAAGLATGGGAASVSAAPSSSSAVSVRDPGDHDGRPIHFGPFDIPRNANVSGGFQWETSNGGGWD
ncbi:hypothetical protein [Streptomyces sp. NPDC046261]|uniref:hypothetical protein n=1 Tax=Streptomyces sp. NPDC046261 TaxID=3157200 RepID=UPI0033F37AD0